jgi:hypothetical protein
MLKLAALAYLPIAATFFGLLVFAILVLPGTLHDFEVAASLYYGAAALSMVLAAPVAWVVARRMLTRRERRLLDAHAGRGH